MREMKINNIAVGTIFLLGFSLLTSPAYAEEIAEEPAPETIEEEAGVWSVVDENGVVTDAIMCTESVCGEDGEFGGVYPENSHCPGCSLVYQQPGYSGFADNGYVDVEYNFENENYELTEPLIVEDQVVGKKQTIVPKGQGEKSDDPKIIDPDPIIGTDYSVDMEIATGFIDKDFNYIEIEVEQKDEKPTLINYANEKNAIENLEKDLIDEEIEVSNIFINIVENITNFIKNIFGME